MLIAYLLLLSPAPQAVAPGAATPLPVSQPRVLAVGDSWAFYAAPALEQVFKAAGDGQYTVVNLGVPGAKTWVFDSPFWLAYALDQLRQHPSIDTVHLAMGSSDFLVTWNKNLGAAAQAALFDATASHMEHIAQVLLVARPNLEFLVSGFDYMNFVETVGANPGGNCWKMWTQDLGQPTPAEVNAGLQALQDRLELMVAGNAHMRFAGSMGFMQAFLGYAAHNLAPFSALLPDASLPTAPEALAAGGTDCAHPSPLGYKLLALYEYASYYRGRFHPAQTFAYGGLMPGTAGSLNSLGASGLAPFAPALVSFGLSPDLHPIAGCEGIWLHVGLPLFGLALVADAAGKLDASVWIPPALAGRLLFSQAVSAAGCTASLVLTHRL